MCQTGISYLIKPQGRWRKVLQDQGSGRFNKVFCNKNKKKKNFFPLHTVILGLGLRLVFQHGTRHRPFVWTFDGYLRFVPSVRLILCIYPTTFIWFFFCIVSHQCFVICFPWRKSRICVPTSKSFHLLTWWTIIVKMFKFKWILFQCVSFFGRLNND